VVAVKKSKPAEYSKFEKLTKKLLGVSKPSLDKEMRKYEERKAAKKKSG
jgi:hypothetical protein